MEKIGFYMDKKLTSLDKLKAEGKNKPVSQGSVKTDEQIRKTFHRFQELASESSCDVTISNRVKMLIRNMLHHRESGWVKTREFKESDHMKIQELRQKLENQLRLDQIMREQAEQEEKS